MKKNGKEKGQNGVKTVHRSEVGTIDSDKQTNLDKQSNSVLIRHTNEQTEKNESLQYSATTII